jgi:hypothetical protein
MQIELSALSSAQLKQIIAIKEQIEQLQAQLGKIVGEPVAATAVASQKPNPKKRKMSAAGKARIIAAQKARWAKIKAAGKAKL